MEPKDDSAHCEPISPSTVDSIPRPNREGNYPQEEQPPSKPLCSFCDQLDLQNSLYRFYQSRLHKQAVIYWASEDQVVADVGNRYCNRRQTDCPLCQIFSASCVFKDSKGDEPVHILEPMRDNQLFAVYFLEYSQLTVYPPVNYYSCCLALFPRGFGTPRGWDHDKFDAHIRTRGRLALSSNKYKTELFTPRAIPRQFDPQIVKNVWLHYCDREHPKCRPSDTKVAGLQVIDCETLAIEDFQQDMRYLALSYVWGNSREPVVFRKYEDKRFLPEQLPRTIRDSIIVTKALGYRYIWVDKYCIDQDRPETKHTQIHQMCDVYENSSLTIIAASGEDESYGLPGVSETERDPQLIIKHKGVEITWPMADPHTSIECSTWATRGWTLQEALLSRRRLVFLDDQVYFECNKIYCFESVSTPLGQLHSPTSKSVISGSVRRGIFSEWQGQSSEIVSTRHRFYASFDRYLSVVEQYTSRQLTYDKDSLNAFRGIIQRLMKKYPSIVDVWGLLYRTNRGIEYFSYALCWWHIQSPSKTWKKLRRRNEFPSWSWSGWEGEIRYWRHYGKDLDFDNKIRAISFEDQDGRPMDITRLNTTDKHISEVIKIEATLVPTYQFSLTPGSTKPDRWFLHGCDRTYGATLFLSQDPPSITHFAKELEAGDKWRCISVGTVECQSFVLVLGWQQETNTWSRAGIFRIECPTLDGVGEQIVWTTIS
ncbi:heterokaryon incompatibility protein-domain-containing protein [Hypomontagnella submonticulosa]|nr:heterokaryon incompatibility protein-domain-containing protein [Hypomontagnella submonticulosa]